jgi:hypothetical protein
MRLNSILIFNTYDILDNLTTNLVYNNKFIYVKNSRLINLYIFSIYLSFGNKI